MRVRQPTSALLAAALATVALACVAPARAQLSPGPLSRAHAALEGVANCTKCHEAGRRLSADRCLDCHTALAGRLRAGDGLHARPGHDACETCHAEHHGREYELVWWGKAGRDAFDHAQAGWPLAGRHAGVACDRCHAPERLGAEPARALREGGANPQRTHLGLDAACAACHADPHERRLGADCAGCHDERGWRPATRPFDHGRARYALTGRHVEVACAKCHPPLDPAAAGATPAPAAAPGAGPRLRLSGLRFASCADCHRDPHEGRLGADCARCHDTAGWRAVAQARFDHDRTRYPLRGRHAAVPCRDCHRPDRPAGRQRFAACTDCHADAHVGQFARSPGGADCARCHTVAGFSPATFTVADHARTAYPLAGAHLATPCVACHARPAPTAPPAAIPFRFATTRCAQCHADPHRGQADRWVREGGCEACHVVESFRAVRFDHAATAFPLEARHAAVSCLACHGPSTPGLTAPPPAAPPARAGREAPIVLSGVATACAACHRDPHAGQFRDAGAGGATRCERCHTPANWRPDRFDHTRDARFVLDGAHRRARCEQCHPRTEAGEERFVRYKPLDTACRACHATRPDSTAVPATAGEG